MGEGLLVAEDRASGTPAAIFSFYIYINSLIFFYIGFTQSPRDLMSPAPQVCLLRDPMWSRYPPPRSFPPPDQYRASALNIGVLGVNPPVPLVCALPTTYPLNEHIPLMIWVPPTLSAGNFEHRTITS